MSNLPPTDLEAFTAAYMDACKDRPADWNEIGYWYARKLWDAAVRLERERLDAIERMGPNGTIRIDDERGLAPRYIHWGGSTGLTLRDAIDAAIRARSQEGQG